MGYKEVESGSIYLVYEEKPNITVQTFLKELEKGAKGLVISRTHPDIVRRRWGIQVPTIWLARGNQSEFIQIIHPERLMKIHTTLSSFIESTDKDKIIMLDGLEYLVTQNDFETIMRFIQLINEAVITGNTIMLLPIHPKSLDEKQMGLLEREANILEVGKEYAGRFTDEIEKQ